MTYCKTCEYETMCTMPDFVRNDLKNCKVYKPKKKRTNADHIRAMCDEELADYIFGVSIGNAPCVLCSDECDSCELSDEQCKEKTLKRLQSEAE